MGEREGKGMKGEETERKEIKGREKTPPGNKFLVLSLSGRVVAAFIQLGINSFWRVRETVCSLSSVTNGPRCCMQHVGDNRCKYQTYNHKLIGPVK